MISTSGRSNITLMLFLTILDLAASCCKAFSVVHLKKVETGLYVCYFCVCFPGVLCSSCRCYRFVAIYDCETFSFVLCWSIGIIILSCNCNPIYKCFKTDSIGQFKGRASDVIMSPLEIWIQLHWSSKVRIRVEQGVRRKDAVDNCLATDTGMD